MRRIWKVILAVSVSCGAVAASSAGCSTDPAKFAGMMERMHPGFLGGLVGGNLQ